MRAAGFINRARAYRQVVTAKLETAAVVPVVAPVSPGHNSRGDRVEPQKNEGLCGLVDVCRPVAPVAPKNNKVEIGERRERHTGDAPAPSFERLIDRLTRVYAIPRPYQFPNDEVKAALYWRARATADLRRLDGDPAAQLAWVEHEESRAPLYDGPVTIDFVDGDDVPAPGLEPLYLPGDPHAGLRRAAMKRPPSWSDPAARPSPGCFCSCCAMGRWWTESANPRGWRCFTCHPPAGAQPGEVTEVRTL